MLFMLVARHLKYRPSWLRMKEVIQVSHRKFYVCHPVYGIALELEERDSLRLGTPLHSPLPEVEFQSFI